MRSIDVPRGIAARRACRSHGRGAAAPSWATRTLAMVVALADESTCALAGACHTGALARGRRALLERADLDDTLSAEQWLLAPLLVASGMAAVCYALADATGIAMLLRTALAAASGAALPCMALRDRIRTRQRQVLRELPGYLDLLTLALEAGCAFNSALQMAVQRSPASPLRMALERSLQEMRAGSQRAEALRRLERRVGVAALGAAVAAIVQAEASGVSLAPVIRAQALRGTRERFARAEKLAMEAPVKMLAPLVLCIFPCTFIVIGFPIAVRLFWGM